MEENKFDPEGQDYEVDPIWERENKKKRKNSGSKGKRGERELVKVFNKRFEKLLHQHPEWGMFHRSVGSGNRWSQAKLSETAHLVFSSDLICENFKFTIESKFGYDHINLDLACKNGNKELDGFLEQTEKDSERTNKTPLLVWKKTGKDRLAFLKDFEAIQFKDCIKYRSWTVVPLEEFLAAFPDSYFFDIK